ncbi:MAG TPA: myo-inosose-2 dehydratase [Myxococcota bacterium]|jgi:inosose dehydratase
MAKLDPQHVHIAAQPINWINDDFLDLGDKISLDRCLTEMRQAGYEGTELGHRFPAGGQAIAAQLWRFGLKLASGWHSTYLASQPYDDEEKRFVAHAEKLKLAGASVVIVAECTGAIHSDGHSALQWPSARLAGAQWEQMAQGLDKLAHKAASMGMKTAYHEHMGTAVQDAADVDKLMSATRELGLLVDTGHLTFAGADPLAVLAKHRARVAHVHLKNVRKSVVDEAKKSAWTFERAVRAGAFTVPGDVDGAVDFGPILDLLASSDYRGWLVVEAEQDPSKADPLAYAKTAREFLRAHAGV